MVPAEGRAANPKGRAPPPCERGRPAKNMGHTRGVAPAAPQPGHHQKEALVRARPSALPMTLRRTRKHAINTIQSVPLRALRIGAGAAIALTLTAFTPPVTSSHPHPDVSLGIDGSANAVEHRLLAHLSADLGVDGSANAVEHRLLAHLSSEHHSSRRSHAHAHRLAR